jgi:enamine deaminase RidA (YjgF/YER057c/UK114 family)
MSSAIETYLDGTEVNGGYARAVKVGNRIITSGTTSLDKQGVVVGVTAVEQTEITMQKIVAALMYFGAGIPNLVKLNVFVADVRDGPAVSLAVARICEPHRPATTGVASGGLFVPGLLVEIAAEAELF